MNNKFRFSILSFLFIYCASVTGQNNKKDQILMTIGDKKIAKTEFENIYYKNNGKDNKIDEKSVTEYLELFINFKLKVHEAEELGLDTTEAFKNELAGYRKQLAQPYLSDNSVTEALIDEAYERMKTDVKASHILIKVNEDALPKDTLAAYNKIMKIRERIIKGEDFSKLAKSSSEDLPSATENAGDLGYFSALQMVYPFESAAFNTKVGEVSMPIRTRYGYHLIKVFDKRKARGHIQVAHIMVKLATNASAEDSSTAKAKIEEIYAKLKAGAKFGDLALSYSDDKGSARKGGELPWFGTGRMVPEFEDAAFDIPANGEYSKPVLTRFGWHLIKRLDKKELAPLDELKAELKAKISKDSRSERSKDAVIGRIKKENGFKETIKNRDEFIKVIDSTFFEGKWNASKSKALNKPLFTLGKKSFLQTDFALYIEKHQAKQKMIPTEIIINKLYESFVDENCIMYEESRLDEKYPEFKALMQEYRDGILLFELTDKKVWSKAVKDTAGLEEFYNINKMNFMWEERVDATIYRCANNDIAKKVRELVKKADKKGYSHDDILKKINTDSQLNLKIETGKFTKNENEFVDKVIWIEGLSESLRKDNHVVFVEITRKYKPEPKTLKEAKGLVTAEYQAFLEKQWIDQLRAKYPVEVNKDVFSTIK